MKFNDAAIGIAEASIAVIAIRGYVVQSENSAIAMVDAMKASGDTGQHSPGVNTDTPNVALSDHAYRPAEWDAPDLVYAKTSVAGYFFDAVIRASHTSTLRKTVHPVQNGAAITDHAYMLPSRLVLEIGMSDCMDSMVAGQFGNSSRSINAYEILRNMQSSRSLLTIQTRLQGYNNMLIESITANDDHKTRDALKATVTFEETIMVNASLSYVSKRPTTGLTKATTKQPQVPTAKVKANAGGSVLSWGD